MTLQLKFSSKLKLEFAFGKIAQGKEMQLYGEYFPAIAPLIMDYENQQVGTFSVIASNFPDLVPEMGAFTQWTSLEGYQGFYSDPKFIKVKDLRDDSLELFSHGHFFQSLEQVIEINLDTDYAVVVSKDDFIDLTTLLTMPLESESPVQSYAGKSLTLALWDDKTEKLLQSESTETEVFQIRFNKPTQ